MRMEQALWRNVHQEGHSGMGLRTDALRGFGGAATGQGPLMAAKIERNRAAARRSDELARQGLRERIQIRVGELRLKARGQVLDGNFDLDFERVRIDPLPDDG